MAEQKQVGDSSVTKFLMCLLKSLVSLLFLNRLITRDLNNNTTTPTFSLFSKRMYRDILLTPYTYEKQIRNAVHIYMVTSSHFRKESFSIFASLSDLAYVISPYKIDPKSTNAKQ